MNYEDHIYDDKVLKGILDDLKNDGTGIAFSTRFRDSIMEDNIKHPPVPSHIFKRILGMIINILLFLFFFDMSAIVDRRIQREIIMFIIECDMCKCTSRQELKRPDEWPMDDDGFPWCAMPDRKNEISFFKQIVSRKSEARHICPTCVAQLKAISFHIKENEFQHKTDIEDVTEELGLIVEMDQPDESGASI